jgi:hypothetical protein
MHEVPGKNWSTRSRDKRRREAGKPVNRLGEAFDTYHPAATRVKGGQKRRSRADALIFGQTAQPEKTPLGGGQPAQV